MKRHLTAVAAVVLSAAALQSCTQMQRDEAVACANALYAARVYTVAELTQVAQSTPACVALGYAAYQQLINEIATKRGIAR